MTGELPRASGATLPGARPLAGRRVLVTRPRAQAAELASRLEALGAEVITLPTIRLEPPDDWAPLDAAIGRLPGFDWLLFTSVNGVAAFRERLARLGKDAGALAGVRIGAIGSETAAALRRAGMPADVVPAEYRAEALAAALAPALRPGAAVLLVRAAEARDVLPERLRAAGARLTVAPAYRTVTAAESAEPARRLGAAGRLDAVTFTSSSTVRGLVDLLGAEGARRLLTGVAVAAIGPITAATLAEYGLAARITPREYTVAALADAIAAHFAGSDA
jgi:uroporphyrinogen III methyltransferase/synthase